MVDAVDHPEQTTEQSGERPVEHWTEHHEPPRIVVGVDGSSSSRLALRWAAALATASGSRLDAVIAWHFEASYGRAYLPVDLNPALDAEKTLSETVDEVFGAHRPTDMRLAVAQGGAAKVLLRESEGARMLVVGSRGRGGFTGLLLGSVSASVAEHATCPVLVVHGESAPPQFAAEFAS
jgi:nucleotide-binding universal stress UspA family protein